MARYRVERTHKAHVAVMTPEGVIIAETDENGEFEADYPFEDDPRYKYVEQIKEKDSDAPE